MVDSGEGSDSGVNTDFFSKVMADFGVEIVKE